MNTIALVSRPRFGPALIALLSFGVAGYALVGYGLLPLGSLVGGDMPANFQAHRPGILGHVFAASIALLIGPLQFWSRLRLRAPRVHRWLGRVYLGFGVGVGGLAGLYMAQFAAGGTMARVGFGLLALAWLFTGVQAFRAIRRGAVDRHRAWMLRNFALTLAAVTLRVELPAALAAGLAFEQAYPVIAWLCWLPNLAGAEYLISRRRRAACAAPPAAPRSHGAPSPAGPRAAA